MNRRQYLSLAATGAVVGVAGCAGDEGQQFPPYPDSESTEFSGEGDTVTDSFELINDGPMILEVRHEGDDRFVAFAIDDEEETFVQGGPTVQAVGPYRGSSIHNLPLDEYRLEIEADGEWTATVYDLPAYEDGIGLSLPVERDGALGGVIGPIDFGELSPKEIAISFDMVTEANWVDLIDREGEVVGTLYEGSAPPEDEEPSDDGDHNESEEDAYSEEDAEMDESDESDASPEGETDQSHQLELSGVGYLSIESGTEWTVSVTETE